MKRFIIRLSELYETELDVEAETAEEALKKVKQGYYDGDIHTDIDDYVEGSEQFEVIKEEWGK